MDLLLWRRWMLSSWRTPDGSETDWRQESTLWAWTTLTSKPLWELAYNVHAQSAAQVHADADAREITADIGESDLLTALRSLQNLAAVWIGPNAWPR
ncbi:MAG: hypothetical protein R3A10_02805 [Caldilineaceae bacterium]